MTTIDTDRLLDQYNTVFQAYYAGLLRLAMAKMAELDLMCAAYAVKATPSAQECEIHKEAIAHLQHVSEVKLDIFSYMTNLSYLVYATTLLDSFISDTTRFLFLIFPQAMGKAQNVPLEAILSAKSRTALIGDAVAKRVREIGHQAFIERLRVLIDKFGLTFDIDEETSSALEHYAGVRNVIVHDQGAYDFGLGEDGALEVTQRTCVRHPIPLKKDSLQTAQRTYAAIAGTVYNSVVKQVLKKEQDERVVGAMKLFQEMTTLADEVWKGDA